MVVFRVKEPWFDTVETIFLMILVEKSTEILQNFFGRVVVHSDNRQILLAILPKIPV